jgi:hypothetical protein
MGPESFREQWLVGHREWGLYYKIKYQKNQYRASKATAMNYGLWTMD